MVHELLGSTELQLVSTEMMADVAAETRWPIVGCRVLIDTGGSEIVQTLQPNIVDQGQYHWAPDDSASLERSASLSSSTNLQMDACCKSLEWLLLAWRVDWI